ncbi:hypothetical protein HCJ66_08100 [Listeria sp. FSL L7-1582]|uniref:hypothetical protein n=1 Tax=Listeria portnoyi TaxID=2713504 RepID=UPI00164EC692|nr:hypothetical protein [Listeria portnoyi]MBC6309516.1 hypothetical protein [Listeria portnoyi]
MLTNIYHFYKKKDLIYIKKFKEFNKVYKTKRIKCWFIITLAVIFYISITYLSMIYPKYDNFLMNASKISLGIVATIPLILHHKNLHTMTRRSFNFEHSRDYQINRLKQYLSEQKYYSRDGIFILKNEIESHKQANPLSNLIWPFSVLAAVFLPWWNNYSGYMINNKNISGSLLLGLIILIISIYFRPILTNLLMFVSDNSYKPKLKLIPYLDDIVLEYEIKNGVVLANTLVAPQNNKP